MDERHLGACAGPVGEVDGDRIEPGAGRPDPIEEDSAQTGHPARPWAAMSVSFSARRRTSAYNSPPDSSRTRIRNLGNAR